MGYRLVKEEDLVPKIATDQPQEQVVVTQKDNIITVKALIGAVKKRWPYIVAATAVIWAAIYLILGVFKPSIPRDDSYKETVKAQNEHIAYIQRQHSKDSVKLINDSISYVKLRNVVRYYEQRDSVWNYYIKRNQVNNINLRKAYEKIPDRIKQLGTSADSIRGAFSRY